MDNTKLNISKGEKQMEVCAILYNLIIRNNQRLFLYQGELYQKKGGSTNKRKCRIETHLRWFGHVRRPIEAQL